jgi:hypothetical protein
MGLPRFARSDKKGRLAMTTAQLLHNLRRRRIDAS